MTSAIWYRALSLVAGAAALGLVANAVRPGGVALASFAPPTECKGPHEGKAAAVPDDLAPAEAAGLCGQPGVVVADTRAAGAFAETIGAGLMLTPAAPYLGAMPVRRFIRQPAAPNRRLAAYTRPTGRLSGYVQTGAGARPVRQPARIT